MNLNITRQFFLSSLKHALASALANQFHRTQVGDSKAIVTSFMRDIN